ncbi:NAD(+)/NADH kinase [Anaerosolibacter carboniphilus]|nr:NAD(+)/NADH kinase [Anaerosolibacter carboniphilus]
MAVRKRLEEQLNRIGMVLVEEDPDVIIVIGGDGTMLSAIRQYKLLQKPFVGINTGTLGFLPTITIENFDRFINALHTKEYDIHHYPLIKVRAKTNSGEYIEEYAFNEILIKHLEPKLMEAKLFMNGRPFNYFTGDGFIITTPMGATGYGIWAGGVATHSELPVYQLIPIHPNDNSINRPLKMPMIIPLDTKMKFEIIKSLTRDIMIAYDGAKLGNHSIAEIEISIANIDVKVLRMGEFDYFEYFKKKIIDKGELRTINEEL